MAGIFNRIRKPVGGVGVPNDLDQMGSGNANPSGNQAVLKKQRAFLYAGGGLGVVAAAWWLFSPGSASKQDAAKDGPAKVTVSTDDLGARDVSQREWVAMSENRLNAQDNRLRALQGQTGQVEQLQQQLNALKAENGKMANQGSNVVSAYETENKRLRDQLSSAQTNASAASSAGPRSLYGRSGPAAYQSFDGSPGSVGASGMGGPRSELKVINFTSGPGAAGGGAAGGPAGQGGGAPGRGNMIFTDSPNYLPANSYAKARVIVGVDASSNVQSQSDPLPVVLRITGPARSVAQNGKVLTTRIDGCLVNGAARGDLSSEKVYVKLAKMTCPQPGGRYAESEVKGFIAFGGKTGVRGRVVSREGGLTMQAFFAGLVGGIGKGFSANTQSFLTAPTTTVINGQRPRLSTSDIAQGGLGEGVSNAGDRLSQYLIERAEQYQPVIEMPTGVEVEIVFLEGAYVRN